MPLSPDRTYEGEIVGGNIRYSSKGTLGIDVEIESPNGNITHTWWVSEKNIERVKKNLVELGVKPEQLGSETFLESIGGVLAGTPIEFTTVADDYKGGDAVRTQWVNARKSNSGLSPAKAAAMLFSGVKQGATIATATPSPRGNGFGFDPRRQADDRRMEITDDDIPF